MQSKWKCSLLNVFYEYWNAIKCEGNSSSPNKKTISDNVYSCNLGKFDMNHCFEDS